MRQRIIRINFRTIQFIVFTLSMNYSHSAKRSGNDEPIPGSSPSETDRGGRKGRRNHESSQQTAPDAVGFESSTERHRRQAGSAAVFAAQQEDALDAGGRAVAIFSANSAGRVGAGRRRHSPDSSAPRRHTSHQYGMLHLLSLAAVRAQAV